MSDLQGVGPPLLENGLASEKHAECTFPRELTNLKIEAVSAEHEDALAVVVLRELLHFAEAKEHPAAKPRRQFSDRW